MSLLGKKTVKETEKNVNKEFLYADKMEQLRKTKASLICAEIT